MEIIEIYDDERVGRAHQVIKRLRLEKLRSGHCFMFFDNTLPDGQAYFEYPNGAIAIEQLDRDNLDLPRIVVKQLDQAEIAAVKTKHEVFN